MRRIPKHRPPARAPVRPPAAPATPLADPEAQGGQLLPSQTLARCLSFAFLLSSPDLGVPGRDVWGLRASTRAASAVLPKGNSRGRPLLAGAPI